MTTLATVVALLAGPERVVIARDGREQTVRFLDDAGMGSRCDSFFLAGFEYGASVLIHARSWETAWEAWVDSRPTIAPDELPEAYGITDDDAFRDAYEAEHPCPPYPERDAWVAWHVAWGEACAAELERRDAEGIEQPLVEGYEYQSNASGTGIVDVGHYAWLHEVDPDAIEIVRCCDDADVGEGDE